jgi:hypothetical protein
MALFGQAHWTGLKTGFISCSYTCGHGATPGTATLVVPMQPLGLIPKVGTLTLSDGVNSPIRLFGCRIVREDPVDVEGGKAIALTIQDRRWRWNYGAAEGFFNQVDPAPDIETRPVGEYRQSGGPYIPGTERTPRDLFRMLFSLAGEVGYTLGGFDDRPRIACDWRGDNPMRAASDVADAIGCRLVFQPVKNKAGVFPLGGFVRLGANLPIVRDHPGTSLPPGPTVVRVRGGPALFTEWFQLEAVGYEEDGRLRPIQELSYRPPNGWFEYYPLTALWADCVKGDSSDVLTSQALAKTYVMRLYRLAAFPVDKRHVPKLFEGQPAPRPGDPGGNPSGRPRQRWAVPTFGKIYNRRAVTLLEGVYEPDRDVSGQPITRPPIVRHNGYEAPDSKGHGSTNLAAPDSSGPTKVGFSIDSARGLVTFQQPIFRVREKDADGADTDSAVQGVEGSHSMYQPANPNREQYALANVYLYTSAQIRDPGNWQHYSGVWDFRVEAADAYGDRVLVVDRPTLVPAVKVIRKGSGTTR